MSQMVVTVELSKEDRERLDNILTALQSLHCETCVQSALSYYQAGQTAEPVEPEKPVAPAAPEKPAADPEPAKAEEPAAAPAPAPAPEPVHTKADIQRKVVELSAAGKKDKVRKIVTAYAAKVSAIPEDKIDEVWDKLAALEG